MDCGDDFHCVGCAAVGEGGDLFWVFFSIVWFGCLRGFGFGLVGDGWWLGEVRDGWVAGGVEGRRREERGEAVGGWKEE